MSTSTEGRIGLIRVDSADNVADTLTKPLPWSSLQKHLRELAIIAETDVAGGANEAGGADDSDSISGEVDDDDSGWCSKQEGN